MKNSSLKRILSTALGVMLVLSVIFVISSCRKEHVHSFGEEQILIEATCTTQGASTKTCTECGHTETTVVPELGHNNRSYSRQEATCLEDGHTAYTECQRCGLVVGYEVIVARGYHVPSEYIIDIDTVVEATCDDDGNHEEYSVCADCKIELDRRYVVDYALGHDLQWIPAREATCVDGWDAYLACARKDCTYDEKVIIPACTDHSPEVEMVVKKDSIVYPTCTTSGSYTMVRYCAIEACNHECEVKVINIPPLGHEYSYHDGRDATCTELGYNDYRVCNKCGDTNFYEVMIPAHGHISASREENLVPATCEENGSYDLVTYCSACEIELGRTNVVIPANGHSLVIHEGKIPCTEIGWKEYQQCTVCGYSTYKEIPITGHNYDETTGICLNGCGDYISSGLSFSVNDDGTYAVSGIGICTNTALIIPSEYNGKAVTAIATGAFKNNNSIVSVIIPDTVKVIGDEAFYLCSKLESVVIGNGVESIGTRAFFYCSKLATVTVGSSVSSIGKSAFDYCTKISNVYYNGSESQWNAIAIDKYNDALIGAARKYN